VRKTNTERWTKIIVLHVLHVLPTRYRMQVVPKSPSACQCQSVRTYINVDEHNSVTCVACPTNTLSEAGSTGISLCVTVVDCEEKFYRDTDTNNQEVCLACPYDTTS